MSKRVKALVKKELLVWARKSIGYTIELASKKIGVKQEKLYSWEAGEALPTIKQLKKMGEVYKRPIAVFYLSEPPKDFDALHDYRRIPDAIGFRQQPTLNLEIRKANYRRQVALDLSKIMGISLPKFRHQISLNDNPELVGLKIRKILKINSEQIKATTDNYQALNIWSSSIEKQGILIFQSSGIDITEMRGFSIYKSPLHVIGLNSKDMPRGRIFTMLHELTHIMLRESGICDISESYKRHQNEQKFEMFCNHVAGAAIVPKNLLLEDTLVKQNNSEEWNKIILTELAKRFRTSRETILRRLLFFGKTSENFYKLMRKQFLQEYAELRLRNKSKEFKIPRGILKLSQAGLTYSKIVLDSYNNDLITTSDVSNYLDIKLKHLTTIENRVFSKSHALGVAY